MSEIVHKPKFGSIGQKQLPGLSKMVEENGEALQVIGKIQQIGHWGLHWDGKKKTLKERLEDEMADQLAAIRFFIEVNGLEREKIYVRSDTKMAKFRRWHKNVLAGRLPNDNGDKK